MNRTDTEKSPSLLRRILRGSAVVAVVLVVAAGIGLLLDRQEGTGSTPGLSRVPGLGQSGPRLGYADTVIRYAERSYEDAAWTERREAGALGALMTTGKGKRLGKLKVVTGLDRDNLWVVDALGNLFRLKDGQWSYKGPVTREGMKVLTARVTADGGVAVGGQSRKKQGFAVWQEAGTQTFETTPGRKRDSAHIHVLADDYLQYFTAKSAAGGSTAAYRLVAGRMAKLRPDKDRAYFVHSQNNVPLKDLPLPYIRATATFESPSGAYGFWRKRDDGAVLRFENGTWILVDRLTRGVAAVRSVWFGEDGAGRFMIAVGAAGLVFSHPFGGPTVEQSVDATQQVPTTTDLTAVWGVDRNNFHVMDSSGTVWRRADNAWRIVVRGLYDQDVVFVDAYVSPDGAIHAITQDSVYVLD